MIPKFRLKLSIDNENDDIGWFPYLSFHRGLKQIIIMWKWVYLEVKIK